MNTVYFHTLVYVASFFFVWYGAGMVLSAVQRLAQKLRLSAFTVSFFLLGILTSLPEIAIGSSAVLNNNPSIFAGNLFGGSIVLFLCVIPLLGLMGGGVAIPKLLDRKRLFATIVVVLAPAFLILDKKLTTAEAVFLIVLYGLLFMFLTFKRSIGERINNKIKKKRSFSWNDVLKIVVGVAILIFSSDQIVNSTMYFAELWEISPFFVSLIVVSIGTNIPEISLAFRSVMQKKHDIALADYMGSASANTLLFGVFTLLHGQTVVLPNHFLQRFVFLVVGMLLFFIFAQTKNKLSRKECAILLAAYLFIVWLELQVIAS